MIRNYHRFRLSATVSSSIHPNQLNAHPLSLSNVVICANAIHAWRPLFLVITVFLCLQGCAKSYGQGVRLFREAPVCCTSLAELPVEQLRIGDKKTIELGPGSPVYVFDSGKSYFLAFALPAGPNPYRVSVSSYLVGDFFKSAYIYSPQLVTLDDKRRVVRSTGPGTFAVAPAGFMESLRTSGEFHKKLEGGLTFSGTSSDERYLIILTTEALLKQKTAIPSESVPMLVLGGSDGKAAKKEEVQVPNAPGGLVSISCLPLAAEKNLSGTGNGGDAAVSEKPDSARTGQTVKAVGPGTVVSENEPAYLTHPDRVSVRLASGRVIGILELGKSSENEARSLFESNGAGLGPVRKNSVSFNVGAATLSPPRVYTPPGTSHQLYFEDNGRLVLIIDGVDAGVAPSGSQFRNKFPGVREGGRTTGLYELQAEISPCIVLIGAFRTVNDAFDSVLYGYTCPTK